MRVSSLIFAILFSSRLDMALDPKQLSEFYEWIGRCITEWAHVDESLFRLCFLASKTKEKQAAIIFYRTPNLDTRLKLVDELIRAVLPQKRPGEHDTEIVREWAKLKIAIEKLLPVRNALAHHPLKEIVAAETGSAPRRKLSVRPSRSQALRGRPIQADRLEASDLPKHRLQVHQVTVDLYEFESHLRNMLLAQFLPHRTR